MRPSAYEDREKKLTNVDRARPYICCYCFEKVGVNGDLKFVDLETGELHAPCESEKRQRANSVGFFSGRKKDGSEESG